MTASRHLLERYGDFALEDLAALRDPEQASARTLAGLRRDELLDKDDAPTVHAFCLLFATHMLEQHGPLPTVVGGLIAIPHLEFAA